MSILKVQKIRHTASNTDVVDIASDGTCRANIVNNLSNRNLIINGAMQVAQRGTSSTTNGYGSLDRFKCTHEGTDEAVTHAQADVASGTTPYSLGFRKSMKLTNGNQTGGAGGGDVVGIDTIIEADDVARSGWNYTSSSSFITLSFWVKSSIAQNFYGYMYAPNRSGGGDLYSFETGSLTANTWTKITKVIPGQSNVTFSAGVGFGIQFQIWAFLGTSYTGSTTMNQWAGFSSGTRTPDNTSTWYTTNDATFEITGVQLEVGSVATDFEHRSFAQELALCQRYYLDFLSHDGQGTNPISNFSFAVGTWYNSTNIFCPIRFPVAMRTAPSMESSNNTNDFYALYGVHFQYYNQNVLSGASNLGARIRPNVTANQGSSGTCTVLHVELAASAQLRFNAEL